MNLAFRIFDPREKKFIYSGGTPSMLSQYFDTTAHLVTQYGMEHEQQIYSFNGDKFFYAGDVIRWVSEDGECYQGAIEYASNTSDIGKKPVFVLAGFVVANPVNITDEVTDDETGDFLPGWDEDIKAIGDIHENPELREAGE